MKDATELEGWAKTMLDTNNDEVFKIHMELIISSTDPEGASSRERLEELVVAVAEGCNAMRRCYAKLTKGWSKKEHEASKRLNALLDRQIIQEFSGDNVLMVAAMISFLGTVGTIAKTTKQLTIADEIVMIFVRESIRYNLLLKGTPMQRVGMANEWRADYTANMVKLNQVRANTKPDNPIFRDNPDLLDTVPILQIFANVATIAYSGLHAEYLKKIYPS